MAGKTLYDKLWDDHVVRTDAHGSTLLYIDRVLVYEVTSPQAFEGMRLAEESPGAPRASSRPWITTCRPRTASRKSPIPTRASRWRRWMRMRANSA